MSEKAYFQAVKNLQITDEDSNLIRSIYPFIEKHIDEIVDEAISILANDPEVVAILTESNLSVSTAREVWGNVILFILSQNTDRAFFERLKKVGHVHVLRKVRENLVLDAIYLFNNTIIKTVCKYGIVPEVEQIMAINKRLGLAAVAIITSYREEIEMNDRALVKFMGIEDKLLDRLIELGRKGM